MSNMRTYNRLKSTNKGDYLNSYTSTNVINSRYDIYAATMLQDIRFEVYRISNEQHTRTTEYATAKIYEIATVSDDALTGDILGICTLGYMYLFTLPLTLGDGFAMMRYDTKIEQDRINTIKDKDTTYASTTNRLVNVSVGIEIGDAVFSLRTDNYGYATLHNRLFNYLIIEGAGIPVTVRANVDGSGIQKRYLLVRRGYSLDLEQTR